MTDNQIDVSSVGNSKISKYSSDNINKGLSLAKKLSGLDRESEKDTDYYYELGLTKFNLEEYQEAISFFDRAITINTLYIDAYYWRGRGKKELRNDWDAIDDFT